MLRRPMGAGPRLALLAATVLAGTVAYSSAHESTEPTINGPDKLGTAYASDGSFDLPGVTLDCPPPEGGPVCHIRVTVKSRSKLRLKAGGSRKIRKVARVAYDLGANGDMQQIHPAVLTGVGETALARYGKIKAIAHVVNRLDGDDEAVVRDLKLTIKPG